MNRYIFSLLRKWRSCSLATVKDFSAVAYYFGKSLCAICQRFSQKGMRSHGHTQTLGFSQGIVDFGIDDDLIHEVFHPTKAGDLLVHHSLTIHRAGANSSEHRSRKAMGFIYYGKNTHEDKQAHEAYQKNLAKELTRKTMI